MSRAAPSIASTSHDGHGDGRLGGPRPGDRGGARRSRRGAGHRPAPRGGARRSARSARRSRCVPVDEPEELIEILPRVHTIVHLVGGVNQPSDDEIARREPRLDARRGRGREGGGRSPHDPALGPGRLPRPRAPVPPRERASRRRSSSRAASSTPCSARRTRTGSAGLWFAATVMGADHGFVVGDGSQRVGAGARRRRGEGRRRDRRSSRPDRGRVEPRRSRRSSPPTRCSRSSERAATPLHLDPRSAAERLTALLEIPVSARDDGVLRGSSVGCAGRYPTPADATRSGSRPPPSRTASARSPRGSVEGG